MRIVALSDLHGHLPEIPPCDLVIVAGDVCPDRIGPAIARDHPGEQKAWFDQHVRAWLSGSAATHKLLTNPITKHFDKRFIMTLSFTLNLVGNPCPTGGAANGFAFAESDDMFWRPGERWAACHPAPMQLRLGKSVADKDN